MKPSHVCRMTFIYDLRLFYNPISLGCGNDIISHLSPVSLRFINKHLVVKTPDAEYFISTCQYHSYTLCIQYTVINLYGALKLVFINLKTIYGIRQTVFIDVFHIMKKDSYKNVPNR